MQRRRGNRLVSFRDDHIREPAWHHQARRTRASARLLLQAVSQTSCGKELAPSVVAGLRSAAVALDQHHGSAVPQVVASLLSMPSDDVVFGPRYPTWACSSCNRGATNWASRVVCACGKHAPEKIRLAAHRNAYDIPDVDGGKAKGKGGTRNQKGKSPVGGKASGSGKYGTAPPTWSEMHTLSERIAEQMRQLENERRSFQASKLAPSEPCQAEGAVEEESADALRSQITELEGVVKSSSFESLRQLATGQLETLKSKLLEKKTPEDRQSAALWKLKKAKLKRTRVLEQLVESNAAVLAAQTAHLELEARVKAVEAEVATYELQLAEATAASLPVQHTKLAMSIPDDVLAKAEHGAEIKEMLASPAYASLLKLQASAKSEADPVAMHTAGPAPSGDNSGDVYITEPAGSWYDFGEESAFFTEAAFNQFKATASRKEFTDMAHQMGFACKKSRISIAEPY